MKQLGEDVSEQLEYVPASFRVICHVRPQVCLLVLRGLLAHILVSKFADHLPRYRQSVMYAREGVELDRSLLAK
jgi:transposase